MVYTRTLCPDLVLTTKPGKNSKEAQLTINQPKEGECKPTGIDLFPPVMVLYVGTSSSSFCLTDGR